jgi:hypothetical protein
MIKVISNGRALYWGFVIGSMWITLVVCFYFRDSKAEDLNMSKHHPIGNETEAIARSAQLTALDTLSDKISAQRFTVTDERTPYLWKKYMGRSVWKIEYTDVVLAFESALPNYMDSYKRHFDVLLDENTGQLISIVSKFDGPDPDLREQPSGSDAEAQLKAEDEIYYGLPEEDPRLTFLDALEVVLNKGIGSPFKAKEIYANYVWHSRGGSPRRAVWVITLRGLPPLPARGAHGDEVPVWQRNHMRNVVDDKTAENLFATNSPQPSN